MYKFLEIQNSICWKPSINSKYMCGKWQAVDYTIIYSASWDKLRELINLTFVSKTHGKSEISLLGAHWCPMDTIKMVSTPHRTTCTHKGIWDVLMSVQCVCKFTWRDLFQKQIKRVCYVQSHLYEHVHHECLYICNWWATINWVCRP